ncbi:MAG: hypothetical protein QXL32_06775, partial [Candidatus Bathyarchaeia archaeon]
MPGLLTISPSSITTSPFTIVLTTRPLTLQPTNGEYFAFDLNAEESKNYSARGSTLLKSALNPALNHPHPTN